MNEVLKCLLCKAKKNSTVSNGAISDQYFKPQDARRDLAFSPRIFAVVSGGSPRSLMNWISSAGFDQGVSLAKRMREGSCLFRISAHNLPRSVERLLRRAHRDVSSHMGAPQSLSGASLSQLNPPAWATTSFNRGWRSMTRRTMSGVQCI